MPNKDILGENKAQEPNKTISGENKAKVTNRVSSTHHQDAWGTKPKMI